MEKDLIKHLFLEIVDIIQRLSYRIDDLELYSDCKELFELINEVLKDE